MKVLIAAPFFPPDVGGASSYTKELVTRLKEKHEVTLLIYGHMPEEVEGIDIRVVEKRQPLWKRIHEFTKQLIREAPSHDVVIAENGPSVEFPLILSSFFSNTPKLLHITDPAAHLRENTLHSTISHVATARAHTVLIETPSERPEILPFQGHPRKELEAFEHSWKEHMAYIEDAYAYVTK